MRKYLILGTGALMLALTATGHAPAQAQAQSGAGVPAADTQTYAGIRTDLELLRQQIEGLRAELDPVNGPVLGIANPAPVIERVDILEAELRRVTAQMEELRHRIDSVVADGTNRIGDLEFRLLELEGGDYSTLRDPAPLGSQAPVAGVAPAPATPPVQGGTPSGAIREAQPLPPNAPLALPPAAGAGGTGVASLTDLRPQVRPGSGGGSDGSAAVAAAVPQSQDPLLPRDTAAPATEPATVPAADQFATALAAYRGGDYAGAARQFELFLATQPPGPQAGEALYWRGESLAALGDWKAAARSYLDSFSGAPTGEKAPEALYALGVSLGKLGQFSEACMTLGEVANRFPTSPGELLARANGERAALGCN